VLDQPAEPVVGELGGLGAAARAAADAVEVDVREEAAQPAVFPFQGVEGGLEILVGHVVHAARQPRPAGRLRYVQHAAGQVALGRLGDLLLGAARRKLLGDDRIPGSVELVVDALEEEQDQDEVAVLGRVHGAPQDVRGGEQMALQLRKRELGHVRLPLVMGPRRGRGCGAGAGLAGRRPPRRLTA
jgi:hypothetical protein